MRRDVVVLPQPDSPTSPKRLAGPDGEGDVVHGLDMAERAAEQNALGDGKVLPDVLNAQQRLGAREPGSHWLPSLQQSAVCSAPTENAGG